MLPVLQSTIPRLPVTVQETTLLSARLPKLNSARTLLPLWLVTTWPYRTVVPFDHVGALVPFFVSM